jgi:arabinose-5-phosphate isomerase
VANSVDKIKEILRIESEAIERATVRLAASDVEKAIELLRCCAGKVIVSGVGKSGVIGQKIAQTLTSTGTVAVYINPSDALHGGLGVVAASDAAIAAS